MQRSVLLLGEDVAIWLAVVGGVAVLTLTVAWAWQIAAEQNAQNVQSASSPPSRDVAMRDGQGNVIAQGRARRLPGSPEEGLRFDQQPQKAEGRAQPEGGGAVVRRAVAARRARRHVQHVGLAVRALDLEAQPLLCSPSSAACSNGWRTCSAASSALARATCRCACPSTAATRWPTWPTSSTPPPRASRPW